MAADSIAFFPRRPMRVGSSYKSSAFGSCHFYSFIRIFCIYYSKRPDIDIKLTFIKYIFNRTLFHVEPMFSMHPPSPNLILPALRHYVFALSRHCNSPLFLLSYSVMLLAILYVYTRALISNHIVYPCCFTFNTFPIVSFSNKIFSLILNVFVHSLFLYYNQGLMLDNFLFEFVSLVLNS